MAFFMMSKPSPYALHHAVFNPVVHHLDEVAGTVRAAMQVTFLRRTAFRGAAGTGRDISYAGRQGF